MARKKCVICGEEIVDEQFVPYKSRYAHQRCFNIAMKTLQTDKSEKLQKKSKKPSTTKPKAELKDCLSEEEYKQKTQLFDYIRSLTTDNQLSAKIYVLTENYIKNYSFTYVGMYQTLVYLHEYTEHELKGDIVGIIPYYYDEAQRFLKSIDAVVESNKGIDINNMYKKKIVTVKPVKRTAHQINIEDI